jgi:undecaprenyl-diphosphatase
MNQLIFQWINNTGGFHGEVLDWWMVFLSDPANAILPFLALALYWAWQGGQEGRRVILGVIVLLAIVDWSGGQIKSWLQALRPCQEMADVRLLVDCGLNSFPSNHSANMAALATYLAFFYRHSGWFFIPLAIGVGLSRIYVGVHYPVDVAAGWIYGMLWATIIYSLHRRLFLVRT